MENIAKERRQITLKDTESILPDLTTPCFVVPTEYGLIPYLPPDVSKDYPILISAADFSESSLTGNPCSDESSSTTENKVSAFGRPTEELGLGKRWLFLSPSANFFNMDEGPKKEGVALYCLNGSLTSISPEQYEKLVRWIHPQCTVSLYSQIPPNATSRQKKLRIEATKKMCADYPETYNFAHGISQKSDSALFAQFPQQFTAKEAKIIKTAIDKFDPTKARMIQFFGHPVEVILARALGFDIFCANLPVYFARNFHAINFPFYEEECKEETLETDALDSYKMPIAIDLRERAYEHDHRPLVEGCTCFACKSYKRSYIHHLLNVHEMLGVELLTMHNVHYYTEFIKHLH